MTEKMQGYKRSKKLRPLAGERELERLSGFWDLVKPFAYSDVVTVQPNAPGTTTQTLILATQLPKEREGILVALAFDDAGEDYKGSPWWLDVMSVTRDKTGAVVGFSVDDIVMGPMKTPLGSLTTPFVLPYPIPLREATQVGIVTANNQANAFDMSAFLFGYSWDFQSNRDVRRCLEEMAERGEAPWSPGLFT